ncbi:cyclic nucleotide-binding domain-containing protein [Trichothermofontia sp.]
MMDPAITVKIFQRQSNFKQVPAGETIFSEGEVGTEMYGILEGEVDFLVDGKVVETIGVGDVFGEGALVHVEGTRGSTTVAKTDCKLAVMNKHRFLFAVQETPEFALEIMRSYSNRLRRLRRML